MEHQNKIPVTIITGFLGAGKTTFINFLLKSNPDKQFALVENEFGAVPIDTKLIKGVDASQMFELKQGCICCTISDEYELVLKELAERFPDVDHLLIETTGIADPAPVIQPFFADEDLKELYEYNGAICLVDALNFENLPEEEMAYKQLNVADLILLNKTENIDEKQQGELTTKMNRLAPLAKIQSTSFGEAKTLDLNELKQHTFNAYSFLSYKSNHVLVRTKTLSFSASLNRAAFLYWLEYTLDIYKSQVYRCKGVVCFQNEPFEYILQGVGGRFELEEGDLIMEAPESHIAFIGKLDGLALDFNPPL
ncbi:GTPase, G3E family [Draconibacterium orientale]|uniref:Cobalamin biosynthesis protein CobW n=1 Tax=Draconibacterium orientale TaxID=1168034 RepID=X5DCF8_9BACT|nr:GTP-binding protein [Draconibacterium orientale]AHW60513.1 cobalamin biosynthesis protein CobW [Draconibacterium orientale]SET44187.1 GTPase, G3E family [Draconibacterium orientale]